MRAIRLLYHPGPNFRLLRFRFSSLADLARFRDVVVDGLDAAVRRVQEPGAPFGHELYLPVLELAAPPEDIEYAPMGPQWIPVRNDGEGG